MSFQLSTGLQSKGKVGNMELIHAHKSRTGFGLWTLDSGKSQLKLNTNRLKRCHLQKNCALKNVFHRHPLGQP